MLTAEQEKWIAHLSNTERIEITPYDPKAKLLFKKEKTKIREVLGPGVRVCLRGSALLKIPGQHEIDIYVPVRKRDFFPSVNQLKTVYGEPGSVYPYRRARFVDQEVFDLRVEVFIINRNHRDWTNSVIFENYLRRHPTALDEYRKLKMEANGLTVQEYYRQKVEFINRILARATSQQYR